MADVINQITQKIFKLEIKTKSIGKKIFQYIRKYKKIENVIYRKIILQNKISYNEYIKKIDVLLLSLCLCGLLSAKLLHAHKPQPIAMYDPDKEYESKRMRKPKLNKNTIAFTGKEPVLKEDYSNWLLLELDNYGCFERFALNQILFDKAEKMGITIDSDLFERLVDQEANRVIISSTGVAKSGEVKYGSKHYDFVKKNIAFNIKPILILSQIYEKENDIPETEIKIQYREKYGRYGNKYKIKYIFLPVEQRMFMKMEPRYQASFKSKESKARKSMEDILQKLHQNKADFEDMVYLYSDDILTAKKGGILGRFVYGKFGGDFDKIIPAMQEGQLSNVLRSKKGFHIVKVLDKSRSHLEIAHIYKQVLPFPTLDIDQWNKDLGLAMEKMNGIVSRLEKGENFDILAETLSENESNTFHVESSTNRENTWDQFFDESLLGLKKGSISDIITTDKGLYLVKILDVKETKLNEEIISELRKEIAYKKVISNYKELAKQLLQEADIIRY